MNADLICRILWRIPGWSGQADTAGLDETAVAQIVAEAERMARDRMRPLAARADAEGCLLEGGRVKTPEGYAALYRQLGEDGWITADLAPDLGGMGLPLALHVAVSLPMEGAALPFMMALGSARAAAHCLAATAPALAAEWCPRIASGDWAATICISEPEAGSDVGRIRTRATCDGEGWRIDGTKCWISFGDHDMADRIGHLCLARTGPAEEGTRGLSLFLVPDRDAAGAPNGIIVERIEEKLGLHGSPTCTLRFEGARATLIGETGRGLPQLFRMIELMRLQVGTQGAGLALDCASLAQGYATERRQGGHPAQPPLPISAHPDMQRQLALLDANAALLTALVLETAVVLDMARQGDTEAAALAAFLLPLAKTFGGELGQASASGVIQVLGGAGYTRDWRAERHFRDARILTIYEGTTGMQAQDFVLRRLVRDGGAGMRAFLDRARDGADARTSALLDRFEALAIRIAEAPEPVQLRAADAVLRAGWCAVSATLAQRLADLDPATARAMRHWQSAMPSAMEAAAAGLDFAFSEACAQDEGASR